MLAQIFYYRGEAALAGDIVLFTLLLWLSVTLKMEVTAESHLQETCLCRFEL